MMGWLAAEIWLLLVKGLNALIAEVYISMRPPMTESITEREWLAVNVMAWRKREGKPYTRPFWVDGEGFIKAVQEKDHGLHDTWNPRENISQCLMLLDKFPAWTLDKFEDVDGTNHRAMVDAGEVCSSSHPNLLAAIVNAVLSASGYKPHD